MPECVICGGKEFYAEAGFFFCQECQTQTQDLREEFLEDRVDIVTRVRKLRIRSNKSNNTEEPLGWTTWEQYNFILLGMINEFVELGASLDIKITILQLWTAYLRKLEVAFTSVRQKKVPKLAKTYNERDAEIIYGKAVQIKKKQKKGTSGYTSGSSVTSGLRSDNSSSKNIHAQKQRLIAAEYERYIQSHESSDGGEASVMNQSLFSMQSSAGQSSKNSSIRIRFNKAAKKESRRIKQLSTKLPRESRAKFHQTYKRSAYCDGPQVMTPIQLWALIYLALRIHDEEIQLADMLRWAREGHLSYYRLDHLLPPEVTLTRKEVNMLYQRAEIKHKGLRRSIGNMAKFLDVWETKTPDLLSLIERYCNELQLPKGIAIYAERMMALSPPRMPFNAKTAWFPNYEGRAMAIIVVVLKMLFAIDGVTEYEISRVVEKINRREANKLFSEMDKPCQCRGRENAENSSAVRLLPRNIEPCVIVHGGIVANYSLNLVFVELVEACKISASLGYQKILSGGNSADAVEAALWWLENDEFFNCGYGSVVNKKGYVEMDACVMNGTECQCGSVVAVRNIEHPISLARCVMENYPNTIIGASGANRLAKIAGLKSISPENIISPASYFANETKYPPSIGFFVDDYRRSDDTQMLKTNNLGAVGCIAWDGRSIVAGTSTGGTSGKMVGRVGDTSLMGCGIFADEKSACCLTGHGESIIKMALARSIVNDVNIDKSTPREILKKHVDRAWERFGHPAGGISLHRDGAWGIYCTNENRDPIPYAVVQCQSITCPSADGEQITEKYRDPKQEELAATTRGLDRSKLFSFCEWQRYIECRRNLLVNVHYPTKLKRDPDTPGNSHLFLNYFAAMKAKSNHREEPAVTALYHLMPRNLTDAMKNVIEKLDETMAPPQKDVEIFPPSFTPQHSYLQQILQNPDKDLPSVLRADFGATKIGYMTKPETLKVLAAHCNINLRIVDTGLHFLEKVVPPYLQPKLPSVKEYNEKTRIERPIETESESHVVGEACDDLEEYLHRKAPFILHVDPGKRHEYEDVFRAWEKRRCNAINNSLDFCFDEVLPDGKLLVRNDDESDDESATNCPSTKSIADDFESASDNQAHRIIDSLDKWNVSMSRLEKRRLVTTLKGESTWPRLYKPNPPTVRDPQTGKFVSLETWTKNKSAKRLPSESREKKSRSRKNDESGKLEISSEEDGNLYADRANDGDEIYVDYDFGLNDNDLSILHETSSNSEEDLGENNFSCSQNETETLFRPYTEYWLLRCVFSQTHQANFRDVLKFLPYNFCWLLEECSSIIEMSEEDLYEEICLVESYYSDILKPEKDPSTGNSYKCKEYRTSTHCYHARKKW